MEAVVGSQVTQATRRHGRWLGAICRWLIAAVLALSAGGKLLAPAEFGKLLESLGLLPESLIAPLQYGIPGMELLMAICLAGRVVVPAAFLLTFFLAGSFATLHGLALISGTVVPCGCLGSRLTFDGWPVHVTLLGVSLAMMGCACAGLFCWPVSPKPDGQR